MLMIRFSRQGKSKQPYFRVIISEKARDPFGRALEILGSYNPRSKDLQIDADRVKYWIDKGAQLSPSINNLFIDKKIIEGEKVKASKGKKEEAKEEVKPAETKTEEAGAVKEEAAGEPAAEAKPEVEQK